MLQKIQVDLLWGTINLQMAFYLVINAIPCVLHMKNMGGLNIPARLLWLGLHNWVAGVCGTGTCELAGMIKNVERVCSTSIWGCEDQPVTWRLYSAEKQAVQKLCLDSVWTRSAIASLKLD